jgi:hypothetical protein
MSRFSMHQAHDSFRDAAGTPGRLPDTVHMETEVVPLIIPAVIKYFPQSVKPAVHRYLP